MAFCTGCGSPLEYRYKFCPVCGTAVESKDPALSAAEPRPTVPEDSTGPGPAAMDSSKLQDIQPAIDRKTLFADGILMLTHEDVILYSPDERDEIKRIPIARIYSCSRGLTKRSLVIKKMINIEENFAKYVAGQQRVLDETAAEEQKQKELLRRARSPDEKQSLNTMISDLKARSGELSKEIDRLQTDPAKIRKVKREQADTVKETFRLPQDYLSANTPSEEYRVWEHAVRRRMAGLSKIQVYTSPPEAVVLVDGTVQGSTPVTFEKPLSDAAAIAGRYEVRVLLEGHKPKTLRVSAAPDRGSENHHIRLDPRDAPDPASDRIISGYRERLPDRTIDLEQYDIEMETEGKESILVLARDQTLALSGDRKRWLLEVPYADITEAKLDKGFMRGIRGIVLTYREGDMSGLKHHFEIDSDGASWGKETTRHRYEIIVERLHRCMEEARTHTRRPRPRLSRYEITEEDISNEFDRFDPYSFETLVARLFTSKGYKTEVTRGSGDMGVDVVARNSSETIAIQVKKWRGNVGGPDVHKTLGSMVSLGATRALVVTTSDFTNQAYDILKGGSPVELWNGQRLANEFREHLIRKE